MRVTSGIVVEMRRSAAVVIVALLGGCSLTFLDRAPRGVPPGAWVHCDEGKALPALDAFAGTFQAVAAVGIAATADDGDHEDLARVAASLYAVSGAVFLYSAYVGFRDTARCRAIRGGR